MGHSREVLGRGSIYTLATAAPMLAGVLVLPVLTRQLTIAEYGHVAIAIVVIQFGTGLAGLGLPTAITRHALVATSGPAGARGIALLAGAIATAIAVAAALSLTAWMAATGQAGGGVFLLALLASGAGAAAANVQAYSLAVNDAWSYVRIAFGLSLIGPATGLFIVFVGVKTAVGYLAGMTGVYVLVGAIAAAKVARMRPITLRSADARAALRVGLPMLPYLLSIGLASGSMVLVASHTFGVNGGAEMQVAISVGSVSLIVTSAINNAWMPAILAAPASERGARLEETAADVAWLAALGAGGIAVLSPWLLRFVSSNAYDRAAMVPVVSVLGVAACVAVVFLANLQLVVAAGETRGMAYVSPLSLAIGVSLALLLAPHIGLVGSAIGFVGIYGSLAVATMIMARKASVSRWRQIAVVPPLLAALITAAFGALLPTSGFASLSRLAAAVLIGSVAARRIRMTFRDPIAAK